MHHIFQEHREEYSVEIEVGDYSYTVVGNILTTLLEIK